LGKGLEGRLVFIRRGFERGSCGLGVLAEEVLVMQ